MQFDMTITSLNRGSSKDPKEPPHTLVVSATGPEGFVSLTVPIEMAQKLRVNGSFLVIYDEMVPIPAS